MYRSKSVSRLFKTFQVEKFSKDSLFSKFSIGKIYTENSSNTNASSIPLSCIHSSSQNLNASLSVESDSKDEIIFPRERVGLNYSLNWSLAKIGVTPQKEAFKNLKSEELKEHGAALTESKSNLPFYTKGQLSPKQYSKLLKEVRSHISASPKVFLGEFAVGIAPKFDSKVKLVSDSPHPNLLLSSFLSKTSSKKIASEPRVSTVYVASEFSFPDLGKDGFSVLDLDTSSLILAGKSFADSDFVQSALTSLSYENIFSKGGLVLPAQYLIKDSPSSVLVLSSKKILSVRNFENLSISKKKFGCVFTDSGVSNLFENSNSNSNSNSPNLYKLPSSVVFLVSESSDAFPPLLKLSPSQAAYHLLAGYDGNDFSSFFSSLTLNPSSLLPSALKLYEILSSKNIPSFVVNINEGDKVIDEKEIEKLIFLTAAENIPKSKLKKPNEASVKSWKEKFEVFVKDKYPELPPEICI